MTKTLAQLEKEIARLQQAANLIRRKEVGGVVARIKDAIDHYGLTPDDLFGKRKRRAANGDAAPAPKRRGKSKHKVPVKYRDGDGNTWTGRGLKPRWLAAAIANGKKLEDFAV